MGRTRQEKIERMLETIVDWDDDSLISYVQNTIGDKFKTMSDDMIDQEYIDWYGDEADIEDGEIFEPESPKECPCACGKTKDVGRTCWWCGN